MPHGPISLGTTYGTYDAVKPNVSITPQSEGWHLGAYSCSGQLTSIRLATEAGRMAYRAGLGPQRTGAEASSPLTGFLFEDQGNQEQGKQENLA